MNPQDLLYSSSHEWVRVVSDTSGTKTITIGITAFALESLTDLIHIELPKVGDAVKAGTPFGEVESVKAVSDLQSPVDGEVIEVNADVEAKLDRLADDPYESGWFVRIRLSDESQLAGLLDSAAYQKQCEQELADE